MKKITILFLAQLFWGFSVFSQNYFENRADIPTKYTWDESSLYSNWEHWEKELEAVQKKVEAFTARDTFKTGIELYETLYSFDDLRNQVAKLLLYASMRSDVNQTDEQASGQKHKAEVLSQDLHYKSAWISPCLQKLSPKSVYQWMDEYPKLKEYEFRYRTELRDKKHVISEEKENFISRFDYAFFAFDDAYRAIMNLDNKNPKIKINDSVVTLSLTKYADILRNEKDRDIRLQAYLQRSKKYSSNKNTIANLITGAAYMQFAYAQSYNYSSTLEYHIDSDSIPTKLYSNLIETMKQNSKPLQRYHELRAKALKLSDYSIHDKRFSIAAPKMKYDIEQAKELIKNSVKILGNDYLAKTTESLDNRTIDYFENKGKITNVAYTSYCYGTSAFILNNHGEGLRDVYDLIHELGHGIHAMYSMKSQPISTYESTIFIDEITSTFNEILLTDYLLNHWKSKENKLYLLENAINNIEYYYNSAIKADFAFQVYQNIENDEEVSAASLDKLYSDIYTSFYGNSFNEINPSAWASYGILDFYDYQYVSSMIASITFFEKIKGKAGKEWIEKYLSLLEAGGNDFPLNQLKEIGIDFTDKSNYTAIANYLTDLVDMYEKELKKNGVIN